MNEMNMAQLISTCRKERKLTQKELADYLGVTDKAVSKWECGLSLPDIALLEKLAEILEITPSELLKGKKEDSITISQDEEVETLIHYANTSTSQRVTQIRIFLTILLSLLAFAAGLICIVCDYAINRRVTWSTLVIISLVLALALLLPSILIVPFKRGLVYSLFSLTLLIMPYLMILELILHGSLGIIAQLGIPISVCLLVYLWCLYWLSRRLVNAPYFVMAISCLATMVLQLTINYWITSLTLQPFLTLWQVIPLGILFSFSLIFFTLGFFMTRRDN